MNGSGKTAKTFRISTLLLRVVLSLAASVLQAEQAPAGSFRVGLAFRSFAPKEPYDWRGAKTHALRTTIWYPAAAAAAEKPLQIPGLNFFVLGNVAQDASIPRAPAKFPLILLSHGTGGTALSLAWFASALSAVVSLSLASITPVTTPWNRTPWRDFPHGGSELVI